MKALFIGANYNIIPIICLQNFIKEFYFINSKPFSKKGKKKLYLNGTNLFQDDDFVINIIKSYKNINLNLKIRRNNFLKFANKMIKIKFHINTSIPEDISKIRYILNKINYLIVYNHDPDSSFLDYINNDLIFVGFYGFCYCQNYLCNKNSIINRLYFDKQFRKKFKLFIYFDNNHVQRNYSNWESFSKNPQI